MIAIYELILHMQSDEAFPWSTLCRIVAAQVYLRDPALCKSNRLSRDP